MSESLTGVLLARNALRNVVGLALPLVVALAVLPILTAHLTTTQFGVLGLVWVFFGLLTELGLGKATTKYAAEAFAAGSMASARRIVRHGVLLQLGVGVLLGLLLGASAGPLAERVTDSAALAAETRTVFVLVAAVMPVIMLSAAYRGVLEAAHRFDQVNAVRVPMTISMYILPAALVLTGQGLVAMTIALALARVTGTVAYAWLGARLLARPDRSDAKPVPLTRLMLEFGAWQTATGVLGPVLAYMDRFMLGTIAGVAAVGLYVPAFEVAMRLLILPTSLVMALFPAFSAWSQGAEADRSALMAARATAFIVVMLAPFVILAIGLGSDALRIWLGPEYAGVTATALAILACGATMNATAYVPATLLQGIGRPDVPAKLYLIQLAPYVVLMIVLISRWGAVGAAAAWSIRATVDSALLFVAAHRLRLLSGAELARARVPQSLLGLALLGVMPAVFAASLGPAWSRVMLVAAAVCVTVTFLAVHVLRTQGRAQLAQALGVAKA